MPISRILFLAPAVCAVMGGSWLLAAGVSASTLSGQVVCSQCWFEADRDETAYGTAEDLACAGRCAAEGVAAALATRGDDGFSLYLLEGSPPGGGAWLAWTGRFVRAEGAIDARGGTPRFRAESLEPLAASPWQQPRPATPAADRAEPEAAAPLAWTDLRGRPVRLDDYRGRMLVLNFWATWCLPCKKEMPDLIDLHDRFAPYGVRFVAAAADDAAQAEGVLAFVRRQKINFPVLLGATTAQMEGLGLPPALPATVVFDDDGHPVERFPGVVDPDALEAALSGLLGLASGAGPTGPTERAALAQPDTHGHQSHASLVPS